MTTSSEPPIADQKPASKASVSDGSANASKSSASNPSDGQADAPPGPKLVFTAPGRAKPPQHLADLEPAARGAALTAAGQPGYRAKQLAVHYFSRWTDDADQLTDLPAGERTALAERWLPKLLTCVSERSTDSADTTKTLWRLFDGALVESVLMRYPERVTICVSSQAGCGMNCPFCATGQAGLTRNMSTAEIVAQVVAGAKTAEANGWGRLSNVVFMGMGEALANYRAAEAALRRLIDPVPDGLGLSARNITMSTVGLVTGMDRLAEANLPVTLALSLHAPDDELRNELVPINTRWSVDEALDAAKRYFDRTGRRISIEYALIRDINDHAWRAQLLGHKLRQRGRGWVHVNPIPLNPTPGSKWTASDPRVAKTFVDTLLAQGIPTTVRDTRGQDIDGACGQLATSAPRDASR